MASLSRASRTARVPRDTAECWFSLRTSGFTHNAYAILEEMRPRVVLSLGNFFIGLRMAAVGYIVLPYLATLMPAAYAGLVITGGAILACIGFAFMPRLVKKYGEQQLVIVFAIAEVLMLLALAAHPVAAGGVLFVALSSAIMPFIAYQLDLLLEATVAKENTTGEVRNLFNTAWNVAAVAAPLIMGALLTNTEAYSRVFLAGAAFFAPFVVLFAVRKLPSGPPPKFSHIKDTLHCIAHDRDMAATTFGYFLLCLFYSWAPLYVPIYLHNALGIPWGNLGWIFSIMLLPFVLVEYPAGWMADKLLGDQEMMLGGFVITGIALASIGFITSGTALAAIAVVLFVSRVGVALVESMTEAHFFRRVDEQDVNSVSVFRVLWPISNIIGPAIGSIILIFGNYEFLFAFTGVFIAVAGVTVSLLIRDFNPKARTA